MIAEPVMCVIQTWNPYNRPSQKRLTTSEARGKAILYVHLCQQFCSTRLFCKVRFGFQNFSYMYFDP